MSVISVSTAGQFRDLASKSNGQVLASVIGQITQHPEIFVFGEYLALDSVRGIAGSKEHAMLELFAYDRFEHYIARKANLPVLTAAQEKKLKQLTIVSMAADATVLPYAQMLAATAISDVRELENLIISCIYAGVLSGKLDQAQQALIVRGCSGRDVRPAELPSMLAFIRGWRHQADNVLQSLVQQQHNISDRVVSRRADAERREKEIADKKEAVQAELIAEQKDGSSSRAATTPSTNMQFEDEFMFGSFMGGDKRRARGHGHHRQP